MKDATPVLSKRIQCQLSNPKKQRPLPSCNGLKKKQTFLCLVIFFTITEHGLYHLSIYHVRSLPEREAKVQSKVISDGHNSDTNSNV